jgi:protein-S-isoprenylcysteine O-methyltransferase Ste14
MIEVFIITATCLLFLLVLIAVAKGIFKKQQIIGRPPIPTIFFILAKVFAFSSLVFLLLRGFKVQISLLFNPTSYVEYIGLAFLITGTILTFLTSSVLKEDLIFGLPKTKMHQLQTKGVYSFSRHPFYLGFLLILFSSALFVPNIFNIIFFITAWILHHLIMIKEEEFLVSKYGDEYRNYTKRVNRYITIG